MTEGDGLARATGFQNQRLVVVPRPLVRDALSRPITRHLVVTDAVPALVEATAARLGARTAPDPAALLASGVDGVVIAAATPAHPELVLAALDAGVERIVYTSSVATLRPDPAGPADERRAATPQQAVGAYKRSKVVAERLVEAMATECLVLAGDTPPVRDAITDGVEGRLLPFFDTAALSDAMIAAAREPERFAPMRAAARARALAGFDRDAGTAAWLAAVDEVAGR